MYRKPEVSTLGKATTLIQGMKHLNTEIANVADEEIVDGLVED